MSFLALRDEIVARFAGITGVRSCTPIDPTWDEAELQRSGSQATPHVLVGYLAARPSEDADSYEDVVAPFDFVATVITKRGDAIREDKDSAGDLAASIASRIMGELIRGERFVNEHGARQLPEMANVTDASLARAGRFVWVVAWSADAAMDDGATLTLVDLETIHTDFDVDGDNAEGVFDTSQTVTNLQESA